MKKYNPKYIDDEEKGIVKSIEAVDLQSIRKPTKQEQTEIKNTAKDYLKKETKMNIRIDPYELNRIKEEAAREGLKYQTFIKSILHKYLSGQLIEKSKLTG
ncbi:MAG: antitoxin [Candidatus Sabulitectum sp.]|nr:antitoxin [Candidatus Sabulitectum sp.]